MMGMNSEPTLIKRYANSRLYDPSALRHVCPWTNWPRYCGDRFIVRDAKTGEDITCEVLDRLHYEEQQKDKLA